MFSMLLQRLAYVAENMEFIPASAELNKFVDDLNQDNFFAILEQIGIIPESINHDSSEEKLFSKVSDAILSRALREIGLDSRVLADRGDSADVIAQSRFHDYSLVADAKAFRLSRTAKNQKDFKVHALSTWRKDSDYAILCSPYFQYPSRSSQIYAQAMLENVCLLSWEHLLFMIKNGIKESSQTKFSHLWNYSAENAEVCTVSNRKVCFIPELNAKINHLVGHDDDFFEKYLSEQAIHIKSRAETEINYWEKEEKRIRNYTRQQAVSELIHALKINGKIGQIETYIKGLKF